MDFGLGAIGDFFSDVSFGDVLGGLTTGAQILGTLDKNSAAADQQRIANELKEREFQEGTRRWNLQFEKEGAGGGGSAGNGAAIAAQMAIQRSNLIKAAHENMSKLALEGRTGEANQLSNIMQAMQNVLLSRPSGQTIR